MKTYDLNGAGQLILLTPPNWRKRTVSFLARTDKRFWIMRLYLITFLIVALLVQVSASSSAQITLQEKNSSLSKVLKLISKQTGYDFIYSDQDLATARPVTFNVKNASMDSVLVICFEDQPLVYAIAERTVLIRKKSSVMSNNPTIQPELKSPDKFVLEVHGAVLGPNRQPLAGASIKDKASGRTVIADANGVFRIANIPEDAFLIVSFVGYQTQEVKVTKEFMMISLALANSKLDEVQVIAYGTTTMRYNTGNVTSVKAAEIAKHPVKNPLLALQGRVPGLIIEQNNGYAGAGVKVRIQGQNSILSDNYPLYVIDGVPYSAQLLPNNAMVLGYSDPGQGMTMKQEPGFGNPLSYINPSDIESIDVLKDAAATSIYGSRAANGAILITTKKGAAGKTSVSFNLQQGVGKVARKMKMLHTDEYLAMRKEAYANDGLPIPDKNTVPAESNYDLTVWDQERYTDWQEVLLGENASYTDLQASISGGTNSTQYLFSGTYRRQKPAMEGNFADQSASVHFNLNTSSANEKFKMNLSASYLMNDNKIVNRDMMTFALSLAPNAPALRNSDGSLNWEPITAGGATISTFYNPLNFQNFRYSSQTSNLVSNMLLSYNLLPGLDIKSNFGFTKLDIRDMNTSFEGILPEEITTNGRFLTMGNSTSSSWVITPQVSYKLTQPKGQLESTIGVDIDQRRGFGMNIEGSGFTSDILQEDMNAAISKNVRTRADFKYKFNAIFGRINYNWDKRYIMELTARRDGSSRFGAENRFHNYAALSGAWLFSNELFFKEHVKFISFGKLKASYGTTGNDQIGDYQYLNTYRAGYNEPYDGVQGMAADKLSNPYLQWEETKKFNIGFEMGFMEDALLVTANYYRNRSGNQLLPYNLPGTTGFNSMIQNFPAILQNDGWEITVGAKILQKQDFSWSANFNITSANNKLVAWPDIDKSSYYNTYFIGMPITVQKRYHFAGVNPETGYYQFKKADGTLTESNLDYTNDYTELVDLSRKYYGGLQQNVSYKNIELSFLATFTQRKVNNQYYGFDFKQMGQFEMSNGNQPAWVTDRWKTKGDHASIQKVSTIMDYSKAFLIGGSDASIDELFYARFQNFSVSWNLPVKWAAIAGMRQARLFAQGQNLATFSSFKGLDPETRWGLPALRTITIGTLITF